MKKFITNIIDYININFSIFFFNNSNLLTYNLFAKFYKKKLANNAYLSDELKNSYSKLGNANEKEVDLINIELTNQLEKLKIHNSNKIAFHLNENIKKSIKNIVNYDLKDFLTKLEKYYNANICLGTTQISRNFPIDNKLNVYSNFYHNDTYTFNYLKFFINLHDVDMQQGPMHIIKKIKDKNFIKKTNYKSRDEYNDENIDSNYFYVNLGKKNEILFCNTTEVLHKAGIPAEGRYRDMLFLTFIAIPKKTSKQNFFYLHDCGHDIFNSDKQTRIFSKPEGIRGIYKLYNSFKHAK